ncbi:MAG TPA: adenylyl-sulfate kinase [Solirubrobacteraceae bacterium]
MDWPRRSDNVTWQEDRVGRAARSARRGATIWLTGLPASGKSTIAGALEQRLVSSGRPAYRLDGDNLRHGLNGDLGFTVEDRAENVRRTAHVAQLFADAGLVAIVALISPTREGRAAARAVHVARDLGFLEVFVDTPLDVCEQRDPKGLYARARAGLIEAMTGIDDPYEPPTDPDVTVTTTTHDPTVAVETLLRALETLDVAALDRGRADFSGVSQVPERRAGVRDA